MQCRTNARWKEVCCKRAGVRFGSRRTTSGERCPRRRRQEKRMRDKKQRRRREWGAAMWPGTIVTLKLQSACAGGRGGGRTEWEDELKRTWQRVITMTISVLQRVSLCRKTSLGCFPSQYTFNMDVAPNSVNSCQLAELIRQYELLIKKNTHAHPHI